MYKLIRNTVVFILLLHILLLHRSILHLTSTEQLSSRGTTPHRWWSTIALPGDFFTTTLVMWPYDMPYVSQGVDFPTSCWLQAGSNQLKSLVSSVSAHLMLDPGPNLAETFHHTVYAMCIYIYYYIWLYMLYVIIYACTCQQKKKVS